MYSNEYKVILGEQVSVWCVGSSIVQRAFLAARQSEGLNLGLKNTTVWWQGYSGLSILSVKSKLETLSKVSVDPNFIILHCGGNDLGAVELKRFRLLVKQLFEFIHRQFPGVSIIWSEILPRQVWRFSENLQAMELSRKRMNSFAGNLAVKMGGMYIRHSELSKNSQLYIDEDGVHLNSVGNKIFLKQLKKGILEHRNGGWYCN